MENRSYAKLVPEAQRGDISAFRGIFDALHDRLYAFASGRLASNEDAIDVVQDTLIDLWKELPRFTYRTDEEFLGFVFVILKRKISRRYVPQERRQSSLEQVLEETGESSILDRVIPEYEDHRHLLRAVSELGEDAQEVIRLRNWSELTFKEIAIALSITETAAKVRHHRAIEALREKLRTYGYA